MRRYALPLVLLGFASARADGPADNNPIQVRRVPKPGISVPDEDRRALREGLDRLRDTINRIDARRHALVLPDVEVFHKAVRDALTHDEFFEKADIAKAVELLKEGQTRAEQLRENTVLWATKPGLIARGYVSRIDGSVQPYGLVVPESYVATGKDRYRLDVWFHGRGETLSEVNFLDQRRKQRGEFTPADTIVLHPYGRYCNAFKFAGEVDVLEAIEDVKKKYKIDDDRISVRGFSMGGAACWQFAVHESDRWFAANPGAGFAETPRFLNVFQRETLAPTWYEKKLWNLYDCDKVARNLFQCPTVAYSGELDTQKQAADVMAEALAKHNLPLTHVIGPKTKHSIHPDSKREIERRMSSLAVRGRERMPREVRFETYTLKYHRMNWVRIDALAAHWERAEIGAEITGGDSLRVVVNSNVRGFSLEMPSGECPLNLGGPVTVAIARNIDANQGLNQELHLPEIEVAGPSSDWSWRASFHREGDAWRLGPSLSNGPRKRHGLQGPIDDAFMDSFVFVRPTGKSRHERVQAWVDAELTRAIERWRRQFRGDARVIDDTALTDAEIRSSHLVLWGDPTSNAVLGRIADRLPIVWNAESIRAGDRSFPADDHALILIAPNPLNPERYVVLNSGFTYREYDDLNNARQVPKLPDWAIMDLKTPPDARTPGKVAAADFFDEAWELRRPLSSD